MSKTRPEYPKQICQDCGEQWGRGFPEDHIATWSTGRCDLCRRVDFVTEPRDFGHLKSGWEKLTPLKDCPPADA